MQIIFEGQQVPGQFGTIENNYERWRWLDAMAAEFHLEIDKITFLEASVISSLSLEFDRIPNSLYWEFRLSRWRWCSSRANESKDISFWLNWLIWFINIALRALYLSPLSLLKDADMRNVGVTSRCEITHKIQPIWYPIVVITTACATVEFGVQRVRIINTIYFARLRAYRVLNSNSFDCKTHSIRLGLVGLILRNDAE